MIYLGVTYTVPMGSLGSSCRLCPQCPFYCEPHQLPVLLFSFLISFSFYMSSSSPISVTLHVSISQYFLSPSPCVGFPLLALSERASWLPLRRQSGGPSSQDADSSFLGIPAFQTQNQEAFFHSERLLVQLVVEACRDTNGCGSKADC